MSRFFYKFSIPFLALASAASAGSLPAFTRPSPNVVVLGDSIAYGDSFVQDLRKHLASALGDRGPGFFSLWSGAWDFTGKWSGVSAYGPFGSAVSGVNGAVAKLTVYEPSDTVDILYVCTPDSTQFSFNVDDVPHLVGHGACSSATFMKETVQLGVVGWHFVRVEVPDPGKAYIWGVSAETGTEGVLVHNISQPGRGVREAGASVETMQFLDVLAPSLTIISLGMNDIGWGIPLDQYEADLSRVVSYASRFGAVIVISENPRIDATTLNPQQRAYHLVNEEIAKAAGVMHVDIFQRWVDYETAAAKGLMSDDGYHPSLAGQLDYEAALWEKLWHPAAHTRMR